MTRALIDDRTGAFSAALIRVLLLFAVLLISSAEGVSQSLPRSQPAGQQAAAPEEHLSYSASMPFALGTVYVGNDSVNFYLMVNLEGDTDADTPQKTAPWGDYISVEFDIDGDGANTENVDRLYGVYPGTERLGYSLHLKPRHWTYLKETRGTLTTTFQSVRGGPSHRVWEFKIPLSELGQAPGGRIRFGIEVNSLRPAFRQRFPGDYYLDFRRLWEVRLDDDFGSGAQFLGEPWRAR